MRDDRGMTTKTSCSHLDLLELLLRRALDLDDALYFNDALDLLVLGFDDLDVLGGRTAAAATAAAGTATTASRVVIGRGRDEERMETRGGGDRWTRQCLSLSARRRRRVRYSIRILASSTGGEVWSSLCVSRGASHSLLVEIFPKKDKHFWFCSSSVERARARTIVVNLHHQRSPIASCALRRWTSSWNSRSIASFGSSLIFGLFLMFFARFA